MGYNKYETEEYVCDRCHECWEDYEPDWHHIEVVIEKVFKTKPTEQVYYKNFGSLDGYNIKHNSDKIDVCADCFEMLWTYIFEDCVSSLGNNQTEQYRIKLRNNLPLSYNVAKYTDYDDEEEWFKVRKITKSYQRNPDSQRNYKWKDEFFYFWERFLDKEQFEKLTKTDIPDWLDGKDLFYRGVK